MITSDKGFKGRRGIKGEMGESGDPGLPDQCKKYVNTTTNCKNEYKTYKGQEGENSIILDDIQKSNRIYNEKKECNSIAINNN